MPRREHKQQAPPRAQNLRPPCSGPAVKTPAVVLVLIPPATTPPLLRAKPPSAPGHRHNQQTHPAAAIPPGRPRASPAGPNTLATSQLPTSPLIPCRQRRPGGYRLSLRSASGQPNHLSMPSKTEKDREAAQPPKVRKPGSGVKASRIDCRRELVLRKPVLVLWKTG